MSDVIIREYRRGDREAILQITEQAFGGFCLEANMESHFGPISGTTWQERKRNGIDYDLGKNSRHVLVAELDGEVAGFACTRLYPAYAIGHLANMAVAGQCQGRGIGKALVSAALDYFRRHEMRYARIETLEQNFKGRNLYPSFGFQEIGRQIFFFKEL